MKIKGIILLLIMFFSNMLHSYAGLDDSTNTGRLINEINKQIRSYNLDGARTMLQELYTKSSRTNDSNALGWYYLLYGNMEKLKGDIEKCSELYKTAHLYAEYAEGNFYFRANLYNEMGTLSSFKGEYNKAMARFIQAVQSAKCMKQIDIREHLITVIYLNIAQLLISNNEYKKAIIYLNKSEALAKKLGKTRLLGNVIMNQGSYYQLINKPQLAMERYQEALAMCRNLNDLSLEQSILGNIGNLLIQQGAYKEAIPYFERSLLIDSAAIPYYTIANIYQLGIGYFYIKDYKKAEHNLLKALQLSQQYNTNAHLSTIYSSLSDLYEAGGKTEEALLYLKKHIQIKDSISGTEQIKNIQQLEARYQSALKDKALTENKALLQRKNTMIIFLVSLTILALAASYIIFRHRNKLHTRKIRILEQQHQIKAVQATMESEENERIRIAKDLHDGIGGMITALNMRLSRIRKNYLSQNSTIVNDLDQPLKLIQEIATEIRHTSRNLIPETLLDLGLADSIRHYCTYLEDSSNTLFNLQFYGSLEKINHSLALSLYRIVQEIGQNIIKHAQATEAVIQLREHKGTIHLHAEDNGTGFDTRLAVLKGRGLANIQSRVEAMKGYFSLSSSPENGTTVHIEIEKNYM